MRDVRRMVAKSAKICDRHFDETDILKGYYIGKDFIAAERWDLIKTAYPKHYLGIYQMLTIVDHCHSNVKFTFEF